MIVVIAFLTRATVSQSLYQWQSLNQSANNIKSMAIAVIIRVDPLMVKEIDIARTATRGIFHLFLGRILSRAIGVIGGLVLIRLLNPEGYGLLNVAVVFPGIFGLFTDFGINAALTKFFAEYRSKGETKNLKSFLFSALVFKIILSLVLTILCYIIADTLAITVLRKPHVAPLIRIASLFVLASSLYEFSGAIFLGLDATRAYAALMILFESINAFLPIILVYSMWISGALLGMAVATLAAGFLGIWLSFLFVTKMTKSSNGTFSFSSALKEMVTYGTPLIVGSLIRRALLLYFGFMIAVYSFEYEIGNYNAAQKIVLTLSYFTVPIASVLFPTFSKINSNTEPGALKKIFMYAVKYSSLVVLPAVALLIILARTVVVLFLGIAFEESWLYLSLLAIAWLSYGFGQTHLVDLLQSQGDTKFIAKLEALTATIGVILGLILIPSFGVLGVILTNLIFNWPSYVFIVRKAYIKYKIKPPLRHVWRLYLSLALTALVATPLALMSINETFKVALVGSVGAITYAVACAVTKAIKESDIRRLRKLTIPQPIIGPIADKVLGIMERVARLKR